VKFNLDLAILSVFCAGGVFAYFRELLRLRRLKLTGKVIAAKIVDLKADDAGSESIVHYRVSYEFVDESGKKVVHERDLSSSRTFRGLEVGQSIEILYRPDGAGVSFPVNQVDSEQRIDRLVLIGLLVFWTLLGLYFAWSG
jgi:hypothetical protein